MGFFNSLLKAGDLVFFERTYQSHERITHGGISVGDGRMIDALTGMAGPLQTSENTHAAAPVSRRILRVR